MQEGHSSVIFAERWLGIVLILLFSCFFVIDLFFPAYASVSNALKYGSILSCLAYSVFSRKSLLLIAAMFFTVCADYFLLFTDKWSAGIGIFIGAQICHILRFSTECFKRSLIALSFAAAAMMMLNLFCPIMRENAEIPIAAFYAFCLFFASFRALQCYRKKPHGTEERRAFWGMLLFIGCDICVALHNAEHFIASANNWPPFFRHAVLLAIWCFYLPSQFLLCKSACSASSRRFS